MFPGKTTAALLVLFAPLGLSLNCSHTTNTAEWTVSATCWDISTASPTKCYWDVSNAKLFQRFTLPSTRSYFYCAETFRLPLSAGLYTYYISLPNSWIVAFKLQIVDPGEPTLENCKSEVREGEKVMCLCSTQHEGNPPPVISWEGQGTCPVLLLQTARREHNKTYSCEMTWGNLTKTVSYDLYVRTDSPVSDRLTTESVDKVEEDGNKNISSLPIGIIVAAAAAVLVLNVATTVIVIIIINRKRTVLNKLRGNKKTGRRRSLPPVPYEDSIQGIIGDNVFISGITVAGTSPTCGS